MQFGMPTLVEYRNIEENIALCRRLGLRFIELNMNFPEYQADRLAGEELICHFHIHDGTELPQRNHLALGDGEIDLPQRLRLAEERNARCVLETKTAAALEQSVTYLRGLGYSI